MTDNILQAYNQADDELFEARKLNREALDVLREAGSNLQAWRATNPRSWMDWDDEVLARILGMIDRLQGAK